MQYEIGETVSVTFNADDEAQALTWAAGDMRLAEPHDPDVLSAYDSAREAYRDSVSKREGITLKDGRAKAMLSVIQRWVEVGPPTQQGLVTDASRSRSYETARAIVAKIVEVPDL